MAVSVQTLFPSNSGMWNLGDPATTLRSEVDGIPVSMAYQYPGPPLESSSMIPSYHLPVDQEALTPDQTRSPAGEKNGGVSKSSRMKRSMSSPNVRGQVAADTASLAAKRRNKLGYHRTSVACGHCRRRKIRCIPAPADQTGRCSNCIRLKKDCQFFSVDQQPPPEPKRRGSKALSNTGMLSQSSSPSTPSGQVPELPTSLPFSPHLNMPPIQDLGGPHMKRQRTESFSPENKDATLPPSFESKLLVSQPAVTTSRNYEYNQGHVSWMASEASPSTKVPTDQDAYWRGNPHDSPMSAAFSPYTPGLQISAPQNWPAHTEPSPREDLSWSMPHRSVSYSNLEGLNSQHGQSQNQYAPYSHGPPNSSGDHYATKPMALNTMYPPPIGGPGMVVLEHPATPHDSQHPQSAVLPSFPAWTHPPSYSYQKQPPPTTGPEQYGSWNHTAHGGPVEVAHSAASPYGCSEAPAGMYYPGPQHR